MQPQPQNAVFSSSPFRKKIQLFYFSSLFPLSHVFFPPHPLFGGRPQPVACLPSFPPFPSPPPLWATPFFSSSSPPPIRYGTEKEASRPRFIGEREKESRRRRGEEEEEEKKRGDRQRRRSKNETLPQFAIFPTFFFSFASLVVGGRGCDLLWCAFTAHKEKLKHPACKVKTAFMPAW